MSAVIFSLLFSVILLGALWFHDAWYPPEGRAEKQRWSRSLVHVEGGNKLSSQQSASPHPPHMEKEADLVLLPFREER